MKLTKTRVLIKMTKNYPLVQFEAINQYEKAADGDVKQYPLLRISQIRKMVF